MAPENVFLQNGDVFFLFFVALQLNYSRQPDFSHHSWWKDWITQWEDRYQFSTISFVNISKVLENPPSFPYLSYNFLPPSLSSFIWETEKFATTHAHIQPFISVNLKISWVVYDLFLLSESIKKNRNSLVKGKNWVGGCHKVDCQLEAIKLPTFHSKWTFSSSVQLPSLSKRFANARHITKVLLHFFFKKMWWKLLPIWNF